MRTRETPCSPSLRQKLDMDGSGGLDSMEFCVAIKKLVCVCVSARARARACCVPTGEASRPSLRPIPPTPHAQPKTRSAAPAGPADGIVRGARPARARPAPV